MLKCTLKNTLKAVYFFNILYFVKFQMKFIIIYSLIEAFFKITSLFFPHLPDMKM